MGLMRKDCYGIEGIGYTLVFMMRGFLLVLGGVSGCGCQSVRRGVSSVMLTMRGSFFCGNKMNPIVFCGRMRRGEISLCC